MLPVTEKLITSPRRPNRKLRSLKGIVIHWTANTNRGAGAEAHWRYLNGFGDRRKASAHYMVDDRTIIRCIPDDEIAYHVGARRDRYTPLAKEIMENQRDSPNNYLIGIELCVNEDNDLKRTRKIGAELTMHLLEQHGLGIDQVYRHLDITGKHCPQLIINGKDEADWQAFLEEVENFRTPIAQPAEQPAPESVTAPAAEAVVEEEVARPAAQAPERIRPPRAAAEKLSFWQKILLLLPFWLKGIFAS